MYGSPCSSSNAGLDFKARREHHQVIAGYRRKTMSKRIVCAALTVFLACLAAGAGEEEILKIKVGGKDLVSYQAKPMSKPKGGDKFPGSNFIHPLKTPAGFVVTDLQPGDHLHHFGLWWPWKYVETGGRKVLCWELQKGDGLIQAKQSRTTEKGFTTRSVYIDRKAKGGPAILLNETLNVTVSDITDKPAEGYYLDMEIIHEVAGDKPITVTKYRYSGFSLRGAPSWNKDNSSVVTSEGKDYDASNFTRAKWVLVQGAAGEGKSAGVLMMSRPDNRDHPEKLRTWNSKTHNGSIFVNFNTVQDKPWVFEPGRKYARNFRVFVYDGKVSAEQAEQLWKEYAKTAESK
jgi:hypothetical protein